jgi:hypothetical protein
VAARIKNFKKLKFFSKKFRKNFGFFDFFSKKLNNSFLKAGKRKRETGGTATEEKRAHLGLLYLSMLMSDPDISGTFSDMDAEIMALAEKSVEAFLVCS